jgi:hypothetical protein
LEQEVSEEKRKGKQNKEGVEEFDFVFISHWTLRRCTRRAGPKGTLLPTLNNILWRLPLE